VTLDLILPSAPAGVADLLPRLYLGAERQQLPELTLSLADGGSIEYTLSGLPDPDPGQTYALTLAVDGVGLLFTWGREAPPSPPSLLIVPYREHAAASDLSVAVFRDGVSGGDVDVEELGDVEEPGDYLLTGWPAPAAGERWFLRWSIDGVHYSRSWEGPGSGEIPALAYPAVSRLARGSAYALQLAANFEGNPGSVTASADLFRGATGDPAGEDLQVAAAVTGSGPYVLRAALGPDQLGVDLRPGLYYLRFRITLGSGEVLIAPPDASMAVYLY
jgi:hypothetical protein